MRSPITDFRSEFLKSNIAKEAIVLENWTKNKFAPDLLLRKIFYLWQIGGIFAKNNL